MKVISLWQPWASLMALDIKSIETRSWYTGYRGPIAIHAAKKIVPLKDLVDGLPFESRQEILNRIKRAYGSYGSMPTGAILCIRDLVNVVRTEDIVKELTWLERVCGDYSPGRFAWETRLLKVLPGSIPAAGKQGFWNFDL